MSATKFDARVFNQTLRRYMEVTSRTLPQVLNEKSFFIARNAARLTKKASAARIAEDLGETKAMELVEKKSGKGFSRSKKHLKSFFQNQHTYTSRGYIAVPRSALLIHAMLSKKGKPSPLKGYSKHAGGQRMLTMMRKMFSARIRSIGFIASGWLPAIRRFAKSITQVPPPAEYTGRQFGKPKGSATAASQNSLRAEFRNQAASDPKFKDALLQIGEPALDRAFYDETISMIGYLQKKMKPDADAFNRAQK